MIHRTARERLLFDAAQLPRDVTTLEGIRGHAATLELSPTGPARLIRVLHEGDPVAWTFALEPGEARPPFHPDDLPYLPELASQVMWDDEAGLQVRWSLPSTGAQISAMRDRVAGLEASTLPPELMESAAALRSAGREERMRILQGMKEDATHPIMAWARETFGDFMGQGLPEEVSQAVDRVVAFHTDGGWSASEESREGKPSRRIILHRDGRERQVHALSVLGITTIGLSEARAGPRKEDA